MPQMEASSYQIPGSFNKGLHPDHLVLLQLTNHKWGHCSNDSKAAEKLMGGNNYILWKITKPRATLRHLSRAHNAHGHGLLGKCVLWYHEVEHWGWTATHFCKKCSWCLAGRLCGSGQDALLQLPRFSDPNDFWWCSQVQCWTVQSGSNKLNSWLLTP